MNIDRNFWMMFDLESPQRNIFELVVFFFWLLLSTPRAIFRWLVYRCTALTRKQIKWKYVVVWLTPWEQLHSGNLTEQCKIHHLKMYFLLKMGIFHCYVSLLEGSRFLLDDCIKHSQLKAIRLYIIHKTLRIPTGVQGLEDASKGLSLGILSTSKKQIDTLPETNSSPLKI